MSEDCKGVEFQPYDEKVNCKPYDASIFSQLTKYEQTLLKGCGVARVAPEQAIQNMLLDVNYFDTLLLKKEGLPFSLDGIYDTVFLKTPQIKTFPNKSMIIPVKPKSDPSPIRLVWNAPPNQAAAHSHFLNIDEKKNRRYDKTLLACIPPPRPPPPPPEMLRRQEETIQHSLEYQQQLLIIIQELVNFVKDSLKQKKLMEKEAEYKDILTKIRDAKKKENEYSAAIDAYTKNSAQAYLTYEETIQLKKEIQMNEQNYTDMENIIKKYTLKEVDETGTLTLGSKTFDIKKVLDSVKRGIKKKVRDSLQGAIDAVVKRMPFYPDEKEMQELRKKIDSDKQFLTTYTDQLEILKQNITVADKNLPVDFKKTTLQLFIEKTLGIHRNITAEEQTARTAEKTNYKKLCDDLKTMETTKEQETYTTIVPFLQTVQFRLAQSLVKNYSLTPKKAHILNLIMKFPNPGEHDFDQFKDIWSNVNCEKSPYYLPPSGNDTSASVIVPTFETFVNLYYTHLNTPSATLLTLLP